MSHSIKDISRPMLAESESVDVNLAVVFDPTRPVFDTVDHLAYRTKGRGSRNQRQRRSQILAAVRQLLIEEGYKGVQVRRIADLSGVVVQTVYNLVGPRDHAIVEAISDYTGYLGRSLPFDPEDPAALIKMIEWQGQSVLRAPEFPRQVCLLYFTEGRPIFQEYRRRQIRSIHALLCRQKKIGVLRPDADCRSLAEEMMFFSSAMFIEWADVGFPTEKLLSQIISGQTHILASALNQRIGIPATRAA
jgi:AcrR family transcriptional regulator